MAPPSSPAWQYFTVGEYGLAKCHLCHKNIRIVRNTSPLIAHLRCKHPEVLGEKEPVTQDQETQTCEEELAQICEEEKIELSDCDLLTWKEETDTMDYDMNYRMREMMALRLDDAVGNMQFRVTTDPMAQLVRALCESSMWMIRDWPNQKIDNYESVRASRLDTLGRLRQLLRARPPKNTEMDGLILLLADALLTISEQWPGGESDKPHFAAPPNKTQVRQQSSLPTATSTVTSSVHIPPMYGGAQGSPCKPPAPKLPRLQAKPWTVDGYEQPSTSQSNSFPPPTTQQKLRSQRESPQAHNAKSPSMLWTFFRKEVSDKGAPIAACKVCGNKISCANHGTTGMKGHLKVHHPAEYATLGLESSASSEASQSSPPGMPEGSSVASPRVEGAVGNTEKRAPKQPSAIIAALNGETLPDFMPAPLYESGLVKEEFKEELEDMDFDEPTTAMDSFEMSSQPVPAASPINTSNTAKKNTSDIWSYFTKGEVDGEKQGFCNLCEWNRRIYNHGTNNMWTHLKRAHPAEHAVLKPHEWNLSLHLDQYQPGPGTSSASGSTTSCNTIARPPPKSVEPREEYEEEEGSP